MVLAGAGSVSSGIFGCGVFSQLEVPHSSQNCASGQLYYETLRPFHTSCYTQGFEDECGSRRNPEERECARGLAAGRRSF